MDVTTLGTSSPYPRPGDPCSSFLVEAGGPAGADAGRRVSVWLDTGPGTFGAFQASCRLEELDAVWVSHTHADHFSDLASVFYALVYADVRRPPLTVFGPAGWADRLRAFLSHGETRAPLERAFDVREVADGDRAEVGGVEFVAVEMHHEVPCFGVRIGDGRSVVAYTGDTGPCDGLTTLAAGADLLISEAGYGVDRDEPEATHLTAAQAGAAARDGDVGRLLLTHLAGADVDACVAAASEVAGCPVLGAAPGERYEV